MLEIDLGGFEAVRACQLAEQRRVEAETNPGFARKASEILGSAFTRRGWSASTGRATRGGQPRPQLSPAA